MMTIAQTKAGALETLDVEASEKATRDALVDRYFELQPQMQRRFSAGVHRELREELHSVTVHQLSVLMHLRAHSVTMRELAKELDVGESAATAVVERLVRQGLVVRHDDPADRRLVRLSLSDTGESLVTKLHETACRKTATLLAALSDDQLAQLIAIMETLEAASSTNETTVVPKSAPQGTSEEEHSR